ncbi:MAG: tetratricopeptide repeat protein [Candidatus Marinimicrobia bacterium]|nr:tetratricopeptide repeat protein [Candidatus Neomarinimicrobiota bacterium]
MLKQMILIILSLSVILTANDNAELQSQVDEASVLLKESKIMESEILLQTVLMEDSTFATALFTYHSLELQRGNLTESQLKLKKAIANKPDDEDYRKRFENLTALVNQLKDAKRELDGGANENSKKIYGEIITNFPDFAEAYYLLGIVNLREDDYKASSKNFKKASSLAPDEAKYTNAIRNLLGKYFKEGMDAYKFGDYMTAEEKFRITIEIDPSFVNAYMQIGIIKRKAGDLDGAITCLEKGVKASPTDVKALYNLGLFYKSSNRMSESKKMFQKAIDVNPNFSKAYTGLAGILASEKNTAKAEAMFKKSLDLNDKSAAAWDGYGALLLSIGKYTAAEKALKEATRLSPRNYRSFFRLAECSNNLKKYNEAIAAAKAATKLNKRFAAAYIEMGFAYYGLGKIDDAINAFNRARNDPQWRKYAEHQIAALRDGKEIQR